MEPRCDTKVLSKVLVLQATEAPQARVLSHDPALALFFAKFSPFVGKV